MVWVSEGGGAWERRSVRGNQRRKHGEEDEEEEAEEKEGKRKK